MIFLGIGSVLIFALFSVKTESKSEGPTMMQNWTRFDDLFKKYGKLYMVDWQMLKAIAMNESSLGSVKSVAHGITYPKDIEASKSQDGKSWGLMQVTVTTGKELDPLVSAEKLNNPEYSIKLAAQYLGTLYKQFMLIDSRFIEAVVKSYNQGPGNTRKELSGKSEGFADEYWDRYQRNYEKVVKG